MVFTALLESAAPAGEPEMFDLGVKYLDSDRPDWKVQKTLRMTFDTTQTGEQQLAALVAFVTADAQRYKIQNAIGAALASLVGQSIEI